MTILFGSVNCPHCQSAVRSGLDYCPVCGFSAAMLHSYLGDQWVRLERITDAAHCLRLEEVREIEVQLDDFERQLPQAFFAVYLGVLPPGLNVSELGFWLLNQGAFNTQQIQKRNDFGTVLVIDASTQHASVSLGYAIERYFPAKTLDPLLEKAARDLRRRDFGAAIRTLASGVRQTLLRHASPGPWRPDSSLEAGIHVQPLRQGHRPSPGTVPNPARGQSGA